MFGQVSITPFGYENQKFFIRTKTKQKLKNQTSDHSKHLNKLKIFLF